MTLTFGSRRWNGRNDAARALRGNGTGIASTGGPPVLAITMRSSFASAVSVGPTSCPRSWFATVPWVTSTIEPAVPTSSHQGGGRKSVDGGGVREERERRPPVSFARGRSVAHPHDEP